MGGRALALVGEFSGDACGARVEGEYAVAKEMEQRFEPGVQVEVLSGTAPKAGGPHYLHRFAVERTACTNTTAAGGNASLLSLGEGTG